MEQGSGPLFLHMGKSEAYKIGEKDGLHTLEDVKASGFHTPQELLHVLEQQYSEGTMAAERMKKSDPHAAKQQHEYWEGFIKSARRSLRSL